MIDVAASLGSRVQPVAHALRCPECGGSLAPREEALACARCARTFPVVNGVPILLSEQSVRTLAPHLESQTGRAMLAEYAAIGSAAGSARPGRRSLVDRLRPPQLLYHVDPRLERPVARRVFEHQGPATIVLNVGGGPTRFSEREITLNLRPFHNVDVVGDAHGMPFADESVDSIVCNAVLEHVHSPERVVSEMLRVLKPGGRIYAEVPYIFFFHGYPNDFRRYTREGMRWLFRDLDDCEVGIIIGPASALLQSANSFINIVLPARLGPVRKLANGAFRYATFWLKYADILLNRCDDAHLLAGAFYATGVKRGPSAPCARTT
jgi:uncharacterized protein YbaR (Trm112 family)